MMRLAEKRLPGVWLLGMVLLILCACQANLPPAPTITGIPPTSLVLPITPEPFPTRPPTLTPSSTAAIEPSPRPTAAATTAPADAPAPLSTTGPWLVLRQWRFNGMGGRDPDLILLNQDGSGRALIPVERCGSGFSGSATGEPGNFMVRLEWETYVINPAKATVPFAYDPVFPCGAYFSKSDQTGLLAVKYQATQGSQPRLRIYQLPEGKLLDELPLADCKDQEGCSPDDVGWAAMPVWDAAGRFLAYPLLLDGGDSGLYVYNVANLETRGLVRFDGTISNIDWSPDGENIIVGLSPYRDLVGVSSAWSVLRAGGASRPLYTTEIAFLQEIMTWVDNQRFLVVTGSLRRVVEEGARNLRLVDIRSGKVTTLFDDGLVRAELDRKTGTVALIARLYNSHTEEGIYLVSLTDPRPRFLGPPTMNDFDWYEDLRLFITDQACQEGGEEYRAFNTKGEWSCAKLPAGKPVTDTYPSPDGAWQAAARDGLWIEGPGKSPAQVFPATPSQVIWQPDSGGFFFIVKKALYHVSLPDLTLKDLGLSIAGDASQTGQAAYQWIGEK